VNTAYSFSGACVITTNENGSIFGNLRIFCFRKFSVSTELLTRQ